MSEKSNRGASQAGQVIRQLGPGLVTGAADDDPSGIATYSQAGAGFGYGLLWTMVVTYPLMSAVQLISAHIGRVTGRGLAANMREILPRPLLSLIVAILFAANTINIGADLAAMGDAARLVLGWDRHALAIGFTVVSVGLQLFVPYHRYVRLLKWLTLSLLAYVAVVLVVRVDWAEAAMRAVAPAVSGPGAIATVVAVFGTTISPYLFFWQSAQEVEEVADRDDAEPLIDAPRQARGEFRRMRIDTLVGMAFSNLVALAIMIATAATLHANGVHSVETAAQAASALRPVAGDFAFLLFALGIVGTGLLALPVLAGSAAFAISDAFGWRSGLEHRVGEARGFYAVIVAAMLLGVGLDWSPVEPIKALFWAAVVNGFAAVPIMIAMLLVATRRSIMGKFRLSAVLTFLGWLTAALMAVAAGSMLVWH